MKAVFFVPLAALAITACKSESKTCKEETPATGKNTVIYSYDSQEAKRIGADEYGMKPYVIAFLKTGPTRETDSTASAKLMRAHLDNIGKMAKAGKLAVAGPFMDEGDIRGIYIFNVKSVEEAEALTKTDPAIQSGHLVMELHPWYGSAAVTEIAERHKIFAKKEI